MSEWTSVLAVFWILWALDGARVARERGFTIVGDARARRGRISYGRVSWPGVSPASWRVAVADVPLSFSPAGLSNVPVGSAGRPAEVPPRVQALRWAEVREVGLAHGWIFINGARFCPDTGHVAAAELLGLARLDVAAREKRIRALMRRWFRPTQLQRRARLLAARTRAVAILNAIALALLVALSVYVVGGFAERLAPRTAQAVANALLLVIAGVFFLHVTAVVLAWRALRKLKPIGAQKRSSVLMSALLLPAQALRLRMILGEGFFPRQHPLAAITAFGSPHACAEWGFCAAADLRWPVGQPEERSVAAEVTAWFASELEPFLERMLADKHLAVADLLRAPTADGGASCTYCPRCRDQFVAGPQVCPHGVALQPLRAPREGALQPR